MMIMMMVVMRTMILMMMTTILMMVIRNKDSHTDICLLLMDMGTKKNKKVQKHYLGPVILIFIIQYFFGFSVSFFLFDL